MPWRATWALDDLERLVSDLLEGEPPPILAERIPDRP